MLTRLAPWLIGLYQRHLSPRKGYACAYRVLHGGTGCSGYAKQAIGHHGALAAIPLIRERFTQCRDAAISLRKPGESEKLNRKKAADNKWDWCASDPCSPCLDAACGSLGRNRRRIATCPVIAVARKQSSLRRMEERR